MKYSIEQIKGMLAAKDVYPECGCCESDMQMELRNSAPTIIKDLLNEVERLKSICADLLSVAEGLRERDFCFVCRHEPDDCQCREETKLIVLIERAKEQLGEKHET